MMDYLAACPCSTPILRFAYSEDPCVDYGGSVDGWTNEILHTDDRHLGTTDTLQCPDGCTTLGLMLLNSTNPEKVLSRMFPMLPFEIGIRIVEFIDTSLPKFM